MVAMAFARAVALLVLLLLVVVGTTLVHAITADVHVLNHRDDHMRTVTVGTVAALQPRGDTVMPGRQLRADTVMPVGPAGGSGGAGAVEEGKGFYAGRPLFKVPPSSPCRRSKAGRC